jgi:hypothetical protein
MVMVAMLDCGFGGPAAAKVGTAAKTEAKANDIMGELYGLVEESNSLVYRSS